jgi:hypothetical protein
MIPNLGIASRKVILGVCQDERNPEEWAMSRQAREIRFDLENRQTEVPSEFDIKQMLVHISQRPVYRSFISMLVRNEALDRLSGADEVILEGFIKEVRAGQSIRGETIGVGYQAIDQDNYAPAQYSMFYEPTPWWTNKARHLVMDLSSKLNKIGVLFPQVQRRKNMSQDTCRRLIEAGYSTEKRWYDLTTLDLELHKMQTGEEIQGECEMRMAWKANDLKPRFYYCTGGTAYWKSRYVKKIAIAMMECIDSTRLQRRQHPEDIQYSSDAFDYICVWDMASFTTQLSELKHFLYYISKGLEENLYCQQNPLKCVDYREGVVEITADKLLMAYNQTVNQEAQYTIYRVCDRIFRSFEDDSTMTQKNSGMLGVHGNIGFSTAFHGFHLEAGVKKGAGCSVGDDALGAMTEDPRIRFIPHMALIGDVHVDKTEILRPLKEDESLQVAKFVKRRLERTHDGISLGYLFSFPALADVFSVRDEYHTTTDRGRAHMISKFISQVGAFFWDIHAIGVLNQEELMLIRRVLMRCYSVLGLPFRGSLPGAKHPAFEDRLLMAVPPLLDFDPETEDWAEALWDKAVERYALLPQDLGPLIIPQYEEGREFIANEGGMLNVLEDIGVIEKMRMQLEWVETSVTNRRRFRSFLAGEKRSFRVRYLSFCPSWFDDVFSDYSVHPYMVLESMFGS